MARVVAKNRIQRTNADGEREVVRTGGVFDAVGDELESLTRMKAIEPATKKDEAHFEEHPGLIEIRRPRVRSPKERRALREQKEDTTALEQAEAERASNKTGTRRTVKKVSTKKPSAEKTSTDKAAERKARRASRRSGKTEGDDLLG